MKSKRDFDLEASTWDDNPYRAALVQDIARTISGSIPINSEMDVLDFGCGTGLLGLLFYSQVNSITGADNSKGMLETLRSKVEKLQLTNVTVKHVDIDHGDRLPGEYHLIMSSMTLHHIKDTIPLLQLMYAHTRPGGYIALADLDPDGGLFHEDNTGVYHQGFIREEMQKALEHVGFVNVCCQTAAEITKPGADSAIHTFKVFLVYGRKPTL